MQMNTLFRRIDALLLEEDTVQCGRELKELISDPAATDSERERLRDYLCERLRQSVINRTDELYYDNSKAFSPVVLTYLDALGEARCLASLPSVREEDSVLTSPVRSLFDAVEKSETREEVRQSVSAIEGYIEELSGDAADAHIRMLRHTLENAVLKKYFEAALYIKETERDRFIGGLLKSLESREQGAL